MSFLERLYQRLAPKEIQPVQEHRKYAIQEKHFFWAFLNIPIKLAIRHFMVIGSTGSGKTTIIRLLLKSVLPRIGIKDDMNTRAIVYDNKREYISLINAIGPSAEVVIFNPFDSRCHAWDISADVTTARHANSIALMLIPEERSQQPFFADAARSILSAVMVGYAKLKERDKNPWSLRDVIVTLRSADRIEMLVKPFPNVHEMVATYLDDSEVLPSILSTIATKMAPYEVVAALWDKAAKNERTMSLSKWLESNSILIIGSSPANRASLDPINRALFKRLFELLLASENTDESVTWVFLDEVREAGKLDGLSSLLNQGRSKGVAVVLGFQEIEGMVDEYGENVSEEIFGQCGHKTFLRTGSPKSAKWIEEYWGQTELLEASFSSGVTRGNSGTSRSENVSYGKQIRPALLASTVMQFPPTGPRSGVLAAVHDIPGLGLRQRIEAWKDIEALITEDEDRRKALPEDKKDECSWPTDEGVDFELVQPWGKADTARVTPPNEEDAKDQKAEGGEKTPEAKKDEAPAAIDGSKTPSLSPSSSEDLEQKPKNKIPPTITRGRHL